MKRITYTICLISIFTYHSALARTQAQVPVTISAPSPSLTNLTSLNVGSSYTYTYTLTNFVPISFPLSISGISTPITRTTVANDCGNNLAAKSSCNIGVTITPTTSNAGTYINQTLAIGYQGRTPLLTNIKASVPLFVAAGMYQKAETTLNPAFITSADGTAWSQQVLATNFTLSSATGLSCNGDTCVAAGAATDDDGIQKPEIYVSTNFGNSWSLQTLNLPTQTTAGLLLGVACVDNICNAVGSYTNTDANDRIGIATSLNSGSTWSQQTLSLLPSFVSETLAGISCSGSTCVAVGYGIDNTSTAYEISAVSTNSGSSWTQQSLSLPAGYTNATLNGVACESSRCIAAGTFSTTGINNQFGIAISTNSGSTWSSTDINPPTGFTHGDLLGIHCSNGTCIAVGDTYTTDSYATNPAIAISTDNGATWSSQALTLPAGYQSAELHSVYCTTQTCVAVGSYKNPDDESFMGIATSSDHGASWSQQILTPPAAEYDNGTLYGVS